jgi:hypothetical protein
MTLLHKASPLFALANTTVLVAADTRAIVPDNVLLCGPASGCTTETIFGREYLSPNEVTAVASTLSATKERRPSISM